MKTQPKYLTSNERGASVIIIAICLVMLVGFIALGIDVSHLYVARNELQNAADAGALAGAGNLYLNNGTAINTDANQFGYDAAVANRSEQVPVEVNWTGGNTGDVQRGHWSFGLGALSRGFYPNASTDTVDLWGVTTEELDANPNFINAVRVRTRREDTPIASYFARIFNIDGIIGNTEAVAYIGFAGTLKPATAKAPIAICEQSILRCPIGVTPPDSRCKYDCNEGRFINDAAGGQDEETGMWTSFQQHIDPFSGQQTEDPCKGGTNSSEVKPLVECDAINGDDGVDHQMMFLGKDMEVNNGQIDAVFNAFHKCWEPHAEDFMPLTLPVIDCAADPTTCAPLVGAVEVMVVHMTQQPNYKDLPTHKNAYVVDGDTVYDPWDPPTTCAAAPDPDRCVWYDFAYHYRLHGADVNPDAPPGPDGQVDPYIAAYQAKTIFFLPSCKDHIPQGVTGGQNFGILAEIPVLVQ